MKHLIILTGFILSFLSYGMDYQAESQEEKDIFGNMEQVQVRLILDQKISENLYNQEPLWLIRESASRVGYLALDTAYVADGKWNFVRTFIEKAKSEKFYNAKAVNDFLFSELTALRLKLKSDNRIFPSDNERTKKKFFCWGCQSGILEPV